MHLRISKQSSATGFRRVAKLLTFPCLHLVWLLIAFPLAGATKPNILFILTDDQGWPSVGCYGNKLVNTPHLDVLARQGMRFTDAYVTPQCTPTRAALITGQSNARSRMWHVIPWYGYPWAKMREPAFTENLPRETFTLAKGLKTAGYTTAIIGKWHLTNNEDGNYNELKPDSAAYYGFDLSVPTLKNEQQHGDKGVNRFTDAALDFIEKNHDRPWFVLLSHHTIHGPVAAPIELVEKYKARGAPETGLNNATYLAALEHFDRSIGWLMASLETLDQQNKTVVVFLSDNGGVNNMYAMHPFTKGPATNTNLTVSEQAFDNAPLRAGKGSCYEGGIRVPCVVRWPGVIKPASVNSTPIHVVDWLPTLLDIAEAKPPPGQTLDGTSLMPLFHGNPLPQRPLYWYLPLYELRWGVTPCAIIREGDLKLIEFFGDYYDADARYHEGHHLELFNLKADLGEQHNLAETLPDQARRLSAKLREWIKSSGAEIPGTNAHYDPAQPFKETRTKPTDP